MKSILLFYISIFLITTSSAQYQTYKTLYLDDDYSIITSDNIYTLNDSTFLLTGNDYDLSFVTMLNKNYEQIWSKEIQSDEVNVGFSENQYHINSLNVLSDTTFQLIANYSFNFSTYGFVLITMNIEGEILNTSGFILDKFQLAQFPYNAILSNIFFVQMNKSTRIVKKDSLSHFIYKDYDSNDHSILIHNIITINDTTNIFLGSYNNSALIFLEKQDSIIWSKAYHIENGWGGKAYDVWVDSSGIYVLFEMSELFHAELDIETGEINNIRTLSKDFDGLLQNSNTSYINKIDSTFYLQSNTSIYQLMENNYKYIYYYLSSSDIQAINDTAYHFIGKLPNFPVKTQEYYNPTDIGIYKIDNLEEIFYDNLNNYCDGWVEPASYLSTEVQINDVEISINTDTLQEDTLTFYTLDMQWFTRDGCVSAPSNIQGTQNIDINISPNPTTGTFSLLSDNQRITSIEIYNELGQLIHKPSFEASYHVELDISHHPTGQYYVKVQLTDVFLFKKLVLVK